MIDEPDNIESRIESELAAKENRRILLRELLGDAVNRTDRLFVHRTMMGDSESYVASVTIAWLGEHVQFAHNLPLFREKLDKRSGHVPVDSSTIDMLTQRPVKFSRQYPMAQYLIARQHHKFPPILAALNRNWVDDQHADQWTKGSDGIRRAVRSASEFEPITEDGDLGLLKINADTTLYALDGQHRLLAVNGVLEFIRYGILEERRDDNQTTGITLTKEELQERYPEITESYLQNLKSEKIGIEILPTVMQGESREEALHRIRRVFVHVNRMAVPLDKGMMTALDEDNGFKIIAKVVCKGHRLFNISGKGGTTENLIEIERPNLTAASEKLTTLESLSSAVQNFLEWDEAFEHWVPKNTALVPRRPEDEELEEGVLEFNRFLDGLTTIPIIRAVQQGESRKRLREFNVIDGRKNLLLRPIGLQSVAYAVGYCHFQKGMDLDVLFKKLIKMDKTKLFDQIDKPSSIWWGLQVAPGKRVTVKKQERRSTKDLLTYLLGGFHDEQGRVDELKKLVIADRTTPPPDEVLYGFDGKALTNSNEFELPAVVTV